ncbi:arsenic resistance N-acetyltransferase ArsN2 [Deinococcus roseus]|uniref:MarR family transcriptional regulator n=1 Tax=Deinococcus roseus TaxID=392414 RepID=A0ABQ2DCT3_9DEIO|nr:arsenic resistance N-acetyltransferase ArsN2 [Deinococcus roseus]GGJ53619.1 hypothetical protein GCM10008938_44560 [Deinococcus roseus]
MPIQAATPADWPRIEALLSRLQLPLQGAQEYLSHFWLQEDQQELQAVAGLELHGDFGLLRSVAVAPEHQNHRHGTALVQHLIQQARQQNLHTLFLLTTTAERYFQKFGFQRILRADLPPEVLASEELQGACPQSATVMQLQLRENLAADLLRQVTRLHYQLQQRGTSAGSSESLTRCHILSELGRSQKMTLRQLVDRLRLDKAWLSRNVEHLLQEGVICKTPHQTDRRASWIELTSKGQQQLEQLNSTLNAQTRRILSHIPEPEHPHIQNALTLLYSALQAEWQDQPERTPS